MDRREQLFQSGIYQDVPQKYVDKLIAFRETHPIRCQVIDGVAWHYIFCGDGETTILILGGLMSTAETSRDLIETLEKEYRILAPGYPIHETMTQFVDGLVTLLELEGIPRVHVFGHSLGAGIGHALIRLAPEKVDKLILSSFGLYNAQNLQKTRRFVWLFRLLPYWFVTGYYKRRIPKLLQDVDQGEKLFLAAYLNDVLAGQLNKQMLMGQFRLLEDMFANPDLYRIYEPVTSQNVLILQARDDTGFATDEQAALRQTYPEATLYLFAEGGHLTRSAHQAEYDAVLLEFLKREPQKYAEKTG